MKFRNAGTSRKEPACQHRRRKRRGFNPWVGKIPWRRAWQPTPVFLPGESRGQRSLTGCSVHGVAQSRTRLRRLSMHPCWWPQGGFSGSQVRSRGQSTRCSWRCASEKGGAETQIGPSEVELPREQRLGSQCRLTAAHVGTKWLSRSTSSSPRQQIRGSWGRCDLRRGGSVQPRKTGDRAQHLSCPPAAWPLAFVAGARVPHLHVHHRSFTFLDLYQGRPYSENEVLKVN